MNLQKTSAFVAIALLLTVSVDWCYLLCIRRPTRSAQGHRSYKLSLYALCSSIKVDEFEVL